MFEHIGPQLRGLPGFDEAAAARLGDMTPEEAAQFREGLIDAIEAQRGAEAAAEEEDEDEAQRRDRWATRCSNSSGRCSSPSRAIAERDYDGR